MLAIEKQRALVFEVLKLKYLKQRKRSWTPVPGDSRTHTIARAELFLSRDSRERTEMDLTWSGQRAKENSRVMSHDLVLMSTQ